MSEEAPLTISVPAAGKKYFGLSRNGAYDAAARGDLPTHQDWQTFAGARAGP
jgi:hypothetical protein